MSNDDIRFSDSDEVILNLRLVKKHLNIDESYTDDDAYLLQLIEAAQNIVLKKLDIYIPDQYGCFSCCKYRNEAKENKCDINKTCQNEEGIWICNPFCSYLKFAISFEPALIQGMLLLIGNLYANREPVTNVSVNKIPYTLEYLLESYKNYSII